MAPLGKKRKAVRNGAPVAVVASLPAAAGSAASRPCGRSDAKAGKATQAPTPRKNCRRFTARRSWELLCVGMGSSSGPGGVTIGRAGGSSLRGTASLKRGRGNNTAQQHARPTIFLFQTIHNPVHGFHIGIIKTAAQGVGEHFLGQATVELTMVLGDEDPFKLLDAVERFAGDQLAGSIDGPTTFLVTPASQGVEVLEGQAGRVEAIVARATQRLAAVPGQSFTQGRRLAVNGPSRAL